MIVDDARELIARSHSPDHLLCSVFGAARLCHPLHSEHICCFVADHQLRQYCCFIGVAVHHRCGDSDHISVRVLYLSPDLSSCVCLRKGGRRRLLTCATRALMQDSLTLSHRVFVSISSTISNQICFFNHAERPQTPLFN
jgi:hypothetical protein